jgi:hypothetical protein
MARSIRCRECRRMFTPDPRVGVRQHTCSEPDCQRERHRKDCRDWRQRTSADRQEARLRRRFVRRPEKLGAPSPRPGPEAELRPGQSAAQTGPPSGQGGSPVSGLAAGSSELNWDAVRDEMGMEVMVLLREFQRILVSRIETGDRGLRDEMTRQLSNITSKTGQNMAKGSRDEMDARSGGP